MTGKLRIAAICLVAAGWIAPAGAQAVYRCGNSYGQQPCAGGAQVETQDARSASQGSQTSQAAQRDAKTAAVMEKDRLKEEAKPAQAYIPLAKASEAAPEDGKGVQPAARAKKPALFTAVTPRKTGDTHTKKKKKSKKKKPA